MRRPGFTLVELLIALGCASVLFAVTASIALRQQRLFVELADNAAVTARLREVTATLPIDLRAVSPTAGDIRDARDTALEVRATIASAVVCDTAGRSIILGPSLPGAQTFANYLTTLAPSDTAWLLDPADTVERWIPRKVTSVSFTPTSRCGRGTLVAAGPFSATTLALDTLAPAHPGTVLRVTRPIRYSLYRASDGSWQLGARDWNSSTLRLNGVQPVAGPLLSPSSRGLGFSYLDSSGRALSSPGDSTAGLALIRIVARAQGAAPVRLLGAQSALGRTDSLDAAVFLHNRR